MNATTIKTIAFLTMILDHIGLFLFPQIWQLRVIGRISFPLFAWLIANGAKHTHNVGLYARRLFMFAVFSQIPYYFSCRQIGIDNPGLNILFTLFMGLVSIMLVNSELTKLTKYAGIFLLLILAELLSMDYGAIGISSILMFYIYSANPRGMMYSQALIFGFLWVLLIIAKVVDFNILTVVQPIALLALPIIFTYNGEQGPKVKYLFYVLYPLQFVVYYLLDNLL